MSCHLLSRAMLVASFCRAYLFVSLTIKSIISSPKIKLKKKSDLGSSGTSTFIPGWPLNWEITKSASSFDHAVSSPIASAALSSLSLSWTSSSASSSLSTSGTSISEPSASTSPFSSSELPKISWYSSGVITEGSAMFLVCENNKSSSAAHHST